MIEQAIASERAVVAIVAAIMGGIGTVLWFAVRRYFVLRTEAEAQRKADQTTHEAQRKDDMALAQKLADTVDKLADRVVALEMRVNALPTEAMLHSLNVSITALAATQQGQQTQLEGIGRSLERMNQYLLENK